MNSLFTSEDAFRTAFNQGLKNLLSADELGAFVLVLANASYDPELFSSLKSELQRRFNEWSARFMDSRFDEDRHAPDDVAVFRVLHELGFGQIQGAQKRMAGIWQLQYNQMRSFRPSRNADVAFKSNRQDFETTAFNFNRPFLRKEIFWEGDVNGKQLRLLYNKFPFAELHGLFVIDPGNEKPQWLSREDHDFVWQFLLETAGHMPMGMGYSSLGAYASINHQHFQSFISMKKYPAELACWEHNGGNMQYPVACRKLLEADAAWQFIDSLQQANIAYNLLYRPGELYCFSRAFQGSYQHADWTPGFAWSEAAGAIAVTSLDDYRQLGETEINRELLLLRR